MASELVELLRQRVRAAYTAVTGVEPRTSELALDAALERLDAALLDGEGQTLTNPATSTVAHALLDTTTTTEWCAWWGGDDPNHCDEVSIRDNQEDAGSLAAVLDLSAGGGVASRSVSVVRSPWRVETPGDES